MTDEAEKRPVDRPSVEIYGLTDPRTGELRYIGKAVDADKRYRDHLRETRRRSPLYSWIASLRGIDLTPRLTILLRCPADQWQECERREIAGARLRGVRLLNLADGGDQPLCPPEVRSANGRANAKRRESTPSKRRIWELKRNTGDNLRRGFVTEAAKVKLREAARIAPELFGEYASI